MSMKHWEIDEDKMLAELQDLLKVGSNEAAMLVVLKSKAAEKTRAFTDAFYERMDRHAETSEFFQGHDREYLHKRLGEWFVELFSGVYDDNYLKARIFIGKNHGKLHLPVRYPLAMLDVVTEFGENVCAEASDPEAARSAFRKVLAVDVALFNQALFDGQMEALADVVGDMSLARRLLTGD